MNDEPQTPAKASIRHDASGTLDKFGKNGKRIARHVAEACPHPEIFEYLYSDLAVSAIARRHKISMATVTNRVRSAGFDLRGRGRNRRKEPLPGQKSMLKLVGELTYEQIGQRFGCRKQNVQRLCKRWPAWIRKRHQRGTFRDEQAKPERGKVREIILTFRVTESEADRLRAANVPAQRRKLSLNQRARLIMLKAIS